MILGFTKYCRLFVVFFFLITPLSVSMAQDEAKGQKILNEAKKHYELKEYDKAFTMFQEAAKEGNVEAYTFLGKMYYNGWGVGHDHEAAYQWHKKAAELGSEESKEKLKKFKHKSDEHKEDQ